MLEKVVVIVHLLMALSLVGLILVQHGKGADAGASFGAGASATTFGSQGSATFLSRITGILAAVFLLTSLGSAYFAKEKSDTLQYVELPNLAVLEQKQEKAPAADDVPVLQEQSKPAESAGDVPAAPEQK